MTIASLLEAVLFAAAKPLSLKRLAEVASASADDVKQALADLAATLDERESGLMLQQNGNDAELVTRPDASDAVKNVVTMEAVGELSRPSLEALTILAYRGPLTRPELEQVRGVQSSLILRNLMMRGLVEEKEDARLGQPTYAVTFDLLNSLGIAGVQSLPDYAELRGHATIQDVLSDIQHQSPSPSPHA